MAEVTDRPSDVVNNVRAELVRAGMTQVQLADALGKHPRWVQRRLARGATVPLRVADVQLIATAVGVSISDLYRGV